MEGSLFKRIYALTTPTVHARITFGTLYASLIQRALPHANQDLENAVNKTASTLSAALISSGT
jgi:hypothetical protein